jgi:hypothetical protein
MKEKKIKYVTFLSAKAIEVLLVKKAKINNLGIEISDSEIINSIIEKEAKK